MKKFKAAGLGLALCVCAGVAMLAMQGGDGSGSIFLANPNAMTAKAMRDGVLRIPGDLSIETPQPFAIDAGQMRRAVRDGELRVALADGTTYPIRIERHYTDASGHWNVVGRADTHGGSQPMVMTFGARAVFGTLPTPDGALLRIVTRPGNKIAIAPAGGSLPPGVDRADANDVVTARIDATQGPMASRAAAPKERITPPDAPIVYPPVDTTPVDIDVFAAYTPEQLSLRGDAAAVETELANLFAITNQAHIDSGSRARFVLSGSREFTVTPSADGESALFTLSGDETIRDERGDLTILIRPYPGSGGCGMAYTSSYGHLGTRAEATGAYSVASVDGACSPYNFAHELGHNMGAMHEREAETRADGRLWQGAYYFSHALRTPKFATLMASPSGQAWVPYFANPDLALCDASPCGIAGWADDVRTFNLMAPAVAQFNVGPRNSVSIPDAEIREPGNASIETTLEVRLNGRTSQISLDVEVVGGTATHGPDYSIFSPVTIYAAQRYAQIPITVMKDDVDEGDETIELRISSSDPSVQIADDTATITIVEPERRELSGKLVFPYDAPAPTGRINLRVYNAEDNMRETEVDLWPPYEFAMKAPIGAEVVLRPELPSPFVLRKLQFFPEVREDREKVMFPEVGVRWFGRVRAEEGLTVPDGPLQLSTEFFDGTDWQFGTVEAWPPEFTFSLLVPRGSDFTLRANPGAPFLPYVETHWGITDNVSRDIVLGSKPVLRAYANQAAPGQQTYMVGYLESPAPAGGVRFRCRTVDRTAKAGTDYVALTAYGEIPEGESGFGYCGLVTTLAGDNELQERFDFVIDEVTGATLSTPSAPIVIYGERLRTGGP